jgi:F-type H+-transporting ATPase subunit beta
MPSAVGYQPTLASEIGSFQERIAATYDGSITSIKAVYVPVVLFAHLDAVTFLSRGLASKGLYPAVDYFQWIDSSMQASTQHYDLAISVRAMLLAHKELQDVIAVLGKEELSLEDQAIVDRSRRMERFLTQPLFVAESFTGQSGQYVSLSDTLAGAQLIMDGKCDHMNEDSFYMKGVLVVELNLLNLKQ